MPSCSKSSSASPKSEKLSAKQPHQVHRRNERERKRVQQINNGYVKLRDSLHNYQNNSRKLSKVETLKAAIAYIAKLQDALQNDSCVNNLSSPSVSDHSFSSSDYSFNSMYSPGDFVASNYFNSISPNVAFDFQAYLRQH
ncbi:hypothetical protein L596_000931 [Steinernema carpocapsae]|uniref:BHLH domain-containing protein n=1 Tax=Steinernema carpocapsae TaxID=34508 RepID=A0A4U8UKB2_STECR|nr:hypothetical protein L596_000931 [Steinernema carpocapsae]